MRLLGRRSGLFYGASLGLSPAQRAARYGLVASWGLAGLTDSFGTNTLTNNNAATFVAGKVGNAVNLASASSQSLSIADNTALSIGTVDAWWSMWVNMAALGASRPILSKNASNTNEEYYFDYSTFATRFRLVVTATGALANEVTATANTFGAPSAATWYHVFGYHRNGVEIGIAINGGAFDVTAHTTGIFDGTSALEFGHDTQFSRFMNGQIDAVDFGKLASGGLTAALVAEIKNYLWNGGSGREYPQGWN